MSAKPAVIPGPGTSRDIVGAARTAVKQGHSTCTIMLTNGTTHEFGIHEVLDDSLLGQRLVASFDARIKVTLVMFSAIAMIEFDE